MFPRKLTTDRLELTAVAEDSLDPLELYEYCHTDAPGIDAVTEYLTWEPHETPKESYDVVENWVQQFEAREVATYVVRPREGETSAGEFAGLAGLDVDWDRHLATLGTWLRQPFWGRGYSGERAHALLAVAFERLDLDAVVVTCHADNEQSYRAISKYITAAGGREEGLLRNFRRYPNSPVDCYRFSVTQAEYAATIG